MAQVTRLGLYGGPRAPYAGFQAAAPSAALSGTVTPSISELLITDYSGQTLIITLVNDTWVAAGAAFDAVRSAIVFGLVGDGVEATGWNNTIANNLEDTVVVRTSDTVVTITFNDPNQQFFDITADETITVTVPASAVVGGSAIAAGTFIVTVYVPAAAAIDSGGGHPGYKFNEDEVAQWLLNFFPPKAVEDLPQEERYAALEAPVIHLDDYRTDFRQEMAQLDRVQALYEEAQKLDVRARTSKAQRKLRQIARDRDRIKEELVQLNRKIRTRKRRNESIMLKIIAEMF